MARLYANVLSVRSQVRFSVKHADYLVKHVGAAFKRAIIMTIGGA